ncbi:MAG: bifunctional 3,4-dihydroxy-2-butanone-4-phosphate synthase/GTP cyclohydrolase II [Candidatus Auribacterota bacterium]|jgi:3,4-dihydroxy 2-butanone 4-phosphate synthase/GTP cyclohydrolase II|uniref:Riboflavin biosynthesis protein RibBA n=1 Tax=Candidatus Auribacter fodinae TaxID=2093366 RepID=A0A3A4RBY1_9BACT|nr:MAG: bifunctional 3,4-dihydroxy-2-butanone-4-phosphate synthase/GTP cyclohydrolase II [Candidatus Auribacter fodinae]
MKKNEQYFNTIEEILSDIRCGKMVIVTDDPGRENEGDLVMAASLVKPDDINFMVKYARGLVCVPMMGERLDSLGLTPMVASYHDRYKTAFSVSVDARQGVSTGISAHDRARTIQLLVNPYTTAKDFVTPGHIFPLRAVEGGVLRRTGHTEAAVDLARLSSLYPAGVICEIMNDDGTMARLPELIEFKKKHDLKMCSVSQIIEYRRRTEKMVHRAVETVLPTKYGTFKLYAYRSDVDNLSHLALVMGDIDPAQSTLVRVHSECLTGDVFGSMRCDCGLQLDKAMEIIAKEGRGVIVYMRQEGRGIGLINKLKAYALQDKGMDTVEANEHLGFEPDLREYGIGAQILKDIGVKNIVLLTNNPKKLVGLKGYEINVIDRMELFSEPTKHNKKYLEAKRDKLGHLFKVI